MYEDYEFETGAEKSEPEIRPAPAAKKTGLAKRILTVILCGALFGACAAASFAGVSALFGSDEKQAAEQPAENQEKSEKNSGVSLSQVSYSAGNSTLSMNLDVSDIAEGMMPAMVSITNISVQEIQSYYGMFGGGRTQTQQSQSSGTGIIIGENDSELLIVTNNHVVEDATTLSASSTAKRAKRRSKARIPTTTWRSSP